ncbi:hypothetical protein P7K49_026514, partial [Saguinus oedipus]
MVARFYPVQPEISAGNSGKSSTSIDLKCLKFYDDLLNVRWPGPSNRGLRLEQLLELSGE